MIEVVTDPAEIAAAYEQLLVPAFSPAELVSASDIVEGVDAGSTEVVVVYDLGRMVGVAIGDFSDGVTLLSYLAVHPDSRGRGWGSQALAGAVDRWFVMRGGIVIAEVEDPAHHASHPQHGDPARRLAFYRERGARALRIPYFQPALGRGLARVPHMLLLALRVDAALLSGDGARLVDGRPLAAMMEQYFAGAEGRPRPADAQARALFAALEDPAGVALEEPISP